MSVNGGWMLTSTSSSSSLPIRYDSFCTNWIASKWLWFIFQFPEMSGRRPDGTAERMGSAMCVRSLPQSVEAGEVAELQQLERRAATGADVVDLVVEPELRECCRGISPAHDRERLRVGHRLCDGSSSCGEALVLEHPHRPVPEHRPSV